ncbi:MAG: hypothetical protein GXO04_06205 [Aquificae bacterium]|nr:hypothetical protein [Aquificota bacterium]
MRLLFLLLTLFLLSTALIYRELKEKGVYISAKPRPKDALLEDFTLFLPNISGRNVYLYVKSLKLYPLKLQDAWVIVASTKPPTKKKHLPR